MFIYRSNPEQWSVTPIIRHINPLMADKDNPAGYHEGEDKGYRNMRTDKTNFEPLVTPAGVITRASYDGLDEYGNSFNAKIVLKGGLPEGKLVVRENVARALDYAQLLLTRFFAGEYSIVAIDGFRSRDRQMDGFTRTMKEVMEAKNITNPTLTELFEVGNTADGTFSWVNGDKKSAEFQTLAQELLSDPTSQQEIQEIATKNLGEGETLEDKIADVVYSLITISANSNIGPAKDQKIPLDFEGNAHAGGGAIDMMLADKNGRILSPVPFDYVGEEAGMDFLESDENCDALIRKIQSEPNSILAQHFKKIGMSATMKDIRILREAVRIAYHLMKTIGATYYSADNPKDGGENWHYQPGNRIYDLDGNVYQSSESAETNPDSGNTGHTIQKKGRDATAVWGGETGHKLAMRDHSLQIEL